MATDAPGPWQPRITRQQPLVTYDELKELESAGVAGEIFARFFDRDGQPCLTSLDRRIVALDLGQLRDVPLVVGVASGKHKAAAILGAARGGYVKSLVTDDVTAAEVLALARLASDGTQGTVDERVPDDGRHSMRTDEERPEHAPLDDHLARDQRAQGQVSRAHA